MRLVDADDLVKRIWYGNTDPVILRGYASGLVDAAPTIEAEPVKHGRWEWNEDEFYMGLTTMTCSLCREEWCFEDVFDVESLNYRYCPSCGAKMDE